MIENRLGGHDMDPFEFRGLQWEQGEDLGQLPSAAAAASAMSRSWATAPPDTPTAPIRAPSGPASGSAAGEDDEAAIGLLEAGRGAAGLAIIRQTASLVRMPNSTAVRGLAEGDVDRAQKGAVHPAERLQARAGVQHGDVDRNADFAGPRLAGGDDPAGLVCFNHPMSPCL